VTRGRGHPSAASAHVLALAALLTGCGGGATSTTDAGQPTACMHEDPTCAAPAPSYSADVRPILEEACATCHYAGSNLARSALTSYSDVHSVYGAALGQVSACLMPPPSQPLLTAEARTTLLTWLACGAPDN